MNIFTKFLSQFHDSSDLKIFVAQWDKLERFVLDIYKKKTVTIHDEETWLVLREQVQVSYYQWQKQLARYWQKALIAGKTAQEDPFLCLLMPASPSAFIDNWFALQNLPAAREALNQLLLEQK